MSEQMRKEFEDWATKEELPILFLASCGFYDAKATEVAWQSWQASRQSQVVKLPDWWVSGIDAAMYRDDVLEALDAAGVRYE